MWKTLTAFRFQNSVNQSKRIRNKKMIRVRPSKGGGMVGGNGGHLCVNFKQFRWNRSYERPTYFELISFLRWMIRKALPTVLRDCLAPLAPPTCNNLSWSNCVIIKTKTQWSSRFRIYCPFDDNYIFNCLSLH